MTHQQQDRARRRLFERLQNRVRGVAIEIIDRVDNRHAHAAFGRRQRKEVAELARIIDGDLTPRLAAIVQTPAQHEEIGMRKRHHTPRNRIFRIDIQRPRANALGAQRRTRNPICERRFA